MNFVKLKNKQTATIIKLKSNTNWTSLFLSSEERVAHLCIKLTHNNRKMLLVEVRKPKRNRQPRNSILNKK